jgi:hypothetical protein
MLAFTALGPIVGLSGLALSVGWLFWIGVGICAVNLILNVASGVMKVPLLPAALMLIFSFVGHPWWRGAAIGLLVWTAFESAGEIWAATRRRSP